MRLLMLLIAAAVPAIAGPDTEDEIRRRQVELQALRDQIRAYEQRIGEQQRTEQATLELLDTFDRKGTLLRRLIQKLRREEEELQTTISLTRSTLGQLESQLSFLKRHYADYVVSVYKAGAIRDVELLLTSRSLNQLSIRNEYLKRFAEQRRTDAARIQSKQDQIEEAQAVAQQQLAEERRVIAEKGAEEDRLAALAEDRRELLTKVRRDRSQLQREIDRKMAAARELEDIITRLIEADRAREAREREEGREGPGPPPGAGKAFAARKGRLRWPVSSGSVVARFGNHQHPTLKTITTNNGIDVAVNPGTPVVAVADGEVATIWWLPSYGNLVILSHSGGYRTVYTHLADIAVSEGEKVTEGTVIGQSGESIDGPRLHFEIWKDRDKQNPEAWLINR